MTAVATGRAQKAHMPPRKSATVRLGTRGSALAVTQSLLVARAITATTGLDVKLVTVSTPGDESDLPIQSMGSTGVFASALRGALNRNHVDVVVHSYKDLPAEPEEGLTVVAIPTRVDPRDGLVCAGRSARLSDLPPGSSVGTGSPRRAALLNAVRPDLAVVPLRGNVDTRLRRLAKGDVDAVVLAMAGLIRLGMPNIAVPVPTEVLLPSPAQGALAVECRSNDRRVVGLVAELDDPLTSAAVTAERAVLRALRAGCSVPLGAYARRLGPEGATDMVCDALVASPTGERMITAHAVGSTFGAAALGAEVAQALLDQGARTLLEESAQASRP